MLNPVIGLRYDQSELAQMDSMINKGLGNILYGSVDLPSHLAKTESNSNDYDGSLADHMDPAAADSSKVSSNPSRAQRKKAEAKKDYESAVKVEFLKNDPDSLNKLSIIAEQVEDCFQTGWFDNPKKLERILGKLKPEQRAALEYVYDQKYGDGKPGKLRKDIRSHFNSYSGRNITAKFLGLFTIGSGTIASGVNEIRNLGHKDKALALLNEGAACHPETAAIALREAMEGAGTDEKTVDAVLDNSSDLRIREIASTYETMFGESITSDIEGDFWLEGEDKRIDKILNALISTPSTTGKATAEQLGVGFDITF